MFGYVRADKMEMKVKDYYKYRAYYCGLCNVLGERGGIISRFTLNFDMTFLAILLTALYEEKSDRKEIRCAVHPVEKKVILTNRFSEYCADMNIALAYYNMLDDCEDDGGIKNKAQAAIFKKKFFRIKNLYKDKLDNIENHLNELTGIENESKNKVNKCVERDMSRDEIYLEIDRASGCFGRLCGELFVYKKDEWEDTLRNMGFYLGKFIYIMDAYEDLPKDIDKNNYNPLKKLCEYKDFEEICTDMLNMMMAQCSRYFERLPIIEDVDILRNILYSGVWNKKNEINKGRTGKEKNESI